MDVGLKPGFLQEASPSRGGAGAVAGSGKVKLNRTDSSPDYLEVKLGAGANISLSSAGGVLTIATTGLSTVATTGNYNDLSNKPSLGTAAGLNVGTSANQVVQLDGSGRLPAVDGSLLTNLSGAKHTIQDEGTSRTARANLNFVGAGVTVTDDAGNNRTVVTIPGGGGGLSVVYSNSATVSASANTIYLLDGTTTLNLPAGSNGTVIGVSDYASNFGSAPLTINPNGSDTIAGNTSLVLSSDNSCVQLAFHGGKWAITQAESFYDFTALLADILPSQSGQNGKYLTTDGSTASWATVSGSKHVIQDEGSPLTARANLNFVGAGVAVTDDSGNDRTVVTIPGGGASAFADLTDVDFDPSPSVGDTFVWNGTLLIPAKRREVLIANRTYYVRTDGNDSNNGLSDSSGGAFLTIQKAVDVVASLDISIYDVTIQLRNGTYTLTSTLTLKSPLGSGRVYLKGDTTTPSNVLVTTSTSLSDGLILGDGINSCIYYLQGFKVTTTGSTTVGIYVKKNFSLMFASLDFGACTAQQMVMFDQGVVFCDGNYNITGGATSHIGCYSGSTYRGQSKTITITGTPNFSSGFVAQSTASQVIINGNTWSGSATGSQYNVIGNSVLQLSGGTLPGNSGGTTATGGQVT